MYTVLLASGGNPRHVVTNWNSKQMYLSEMAALPNSINGYLWWIIMEADCLIYRHLTKMAPLPDSSHDDVIFLDIGSLVH